MQRSFNFQFSDRNKQILMLQIEKDGLNSINVKDILLEMRKSRMGLIQTPDQLRFSYEAIIEGAKHLPLESLSNMVSESQIVSLSDPKVIIKAILNVITKIIKSKIMIPILLLYLTKRLKK